MKKNLLLAGASLLLTLVVLYFWPALQCSVGSNISPSTYAVTRELARLGLFFSIAPMLMGLVPNMNRGRIALYFLATMGFLINLLGEANAGNVILEAGLMFQMAWSLGANWNRHQPVVRKVQPWLHGAVIMAVAYGLGLLAVELWPVSAETQLSGEIWHWLAVCGGVSLFIEVNLLETGVLRGDTPVYIAIHGLGSGLLTVSYLGQYSEAGLTLNVALFSIALYSFCRKMLA